MTKFHEARQIRRVSTHNLTPVYPKKDLPCNHLTRESRCTRPPISTPESSPNRCSGARQGALATLMAGSGDPYCSLVNLASHPDGSPILLISRLAVHTRNILADHRVSLMLDERAAGDPLEGARIMLAGRAEQADADKALRRRYLNAHPSAEAFVSFKDFSFFRIRPLEPIWSPASAASSISSPSSS